MYFVVKQSGGLACASTALSWRHMSEHVTIALFICGTPHVNSYSLILKFTQVQKPTIKAACSLLVMCTVTAEKLRLSDRNFPESRVNPLVSHECLQLTNTLQ